MHGAVDAHAHEALRAQFVEQIGLFALAADDQRREDHQRRFGRQMQHMVDHLRHALRLQHDAVFGAVRLAGAREQQAQVIVDFGDGADGRARVVAGGLLFDRDRRRQAFDQIDVRFFHQLQKLPGIRRQRLDVAPLAFRIERVEGERGLSRTGKSGDDDQLLPWQIEADVLQVVRARAAHADPACAGCLRCGLQRNDVRALQWHDGDGLFVPVLPARGVRAAKPANIPLPDVFSHAALSYAVNRADLPCPLLNA